MVNEGDAAYTTNLCLMCFNKHIQAKGEEPPTNVKWRQVVEKKPYRGRMWKMKGKEPCLRVMWKHFSCERSKAKKYRQLADEEKQEGIQGQWQQESPAREYLLPVKCCHDTDCSESPQRMKSTPIGTDHFGCQHASSSQAPRPPFALPTKHILDPIPQSVRSHLGLIFQLWPNRGRNTRMKKS